MNKWKNGVLIGRKEVGGRGVGSAYTFGSPGLSPKIEMKAKFTLILSFLMLVTTSASAQQRNIYASSFSSNGRFDKEKGIYWLDIPTHFGEWKFRNLPEKRFKERVEIRFEMMMTDAQDSPGKEGRIRVMVLNPQIGQREEKSIFMRNRGGFTVSSSMAIPVSLVKAGMLNVMVQPEKGSILRLGLRHNSIWVIEPEWMFEAGTAPEIILTPTAYTPLRGRAPGGERYYRMGINFFTVYMPRAEIEALKQETAAFLGLTFKWKLMEEYRYRPAISIGFTGLYPFLRRPKYMKGEVFGIIFVAVSKSLASRITLGTGLAKGTIVDMLTYIPATEQREIDSRARNLILGGARLKLNSWFSVKAEGYQSLSDNKWYLTPALCISTLSEHLNYNLGVAYSNLNPDRKTENYLLIRVKW